MTKYIKKIISGGQTGVDLGALRAAKKMGIITGGYIPKGFRTENGPNKRLGIVYGLKEHSSTEYPPRTRKNVVNSDMVIIFDPDKKGGRGTKLTIRIAEELKKNRLIVYNLNAPMQEYHLATSIRYFSQLEKEPIVIDVAGPSESSFPGIEMLTYLIFKKTFSLLQKWEGRNEKSTTRRN